MRQFNFGPRDAGGAKGFVSDFGERYQATRGYGWKNTIANNSRKRGVREEHFCDTFLFTRDSATWECDVASGNWQVTVCVGDAAHDQRGQRVTVEGDELIAGASTAAGQFHEASAVCDVSDGRLTVDLGPQQPTQNTCLNWIRIVPVPSEAGQ